MNEEQSNFQLEEDALLIFQSPHYQTSISKKTILMYTRFLTLYDQVYSRECGGREGVSLNNMIVNQLYV